MLSECVEFREHREQLFRERSDSQPVCVWSGCVAPDLQRDVRREITTTENSMHRLRNTQVS